MIKRWPRLGYLLTCNCTK